MASLKGMKGIFQDMFQKRKCQQIDNNILMLECRIWNREVNKVQVSGVGSKEKSITDSTTTNFHHAHYLPVQLYTYCVLSNAFIITIIVIYHIIL